MCNFYPALELELALKLDKYNSSFKNVGNSEGWVSL